MFRNRPGMLTAALALFLACGPASAGSLDQEMKAHGPEVVKYLKGQDCQAVGVLKFLVSVGKGELSDNAGPLNHGLANRLEVALVLALPDDTGLRLATRASEAVARSDNAVRATHRTKKGRREFFPPFINTTNFQPAWGEGPIAPDAFLTGEARVSADLKMVDVKVRYFDKRDPATLATVCSFTALADLPVQAAAGASFVRSRGVVEADDEERFAGDPAAIPPPDAFLAEAPDRLKVYTEAVEKVPVRLTAYYNDRPVGIKADRLPDPPEGTKVRFLLTNDSKTKTYAVVLKVNGVNTLFKETETPLFCHKWILEPGKSTEVKGFQGDEIKDKEFKILPPRESEKEAVNYGLAAGKVQLVVFREETPEDRAEIEREADRREEVKPISRGTLDVPVDQPINLAALKGALREVEAQGRGIIVEGAEGTSLIKRVPFKSYPKPILWRTIRYYDPPR